MPHDPHARQITDTLVLAAMSHPLRQRLLDVLQVDGPATASVLAQRTDQAVGNISHHLGVLAKADLIEEAPELARDRRERWWKRTSAGLRVSARDFRGDPAAEVIAAAAASLELEHHIALVRAWMASDESDQDSWAGAPFMNDHWLRLTPAELAELGEEVVALFRRWADPPTDDGAEQRRSVFVFAVGTPGSP